MYITQTRNRPETVRNFRNVSGRFDSDPRGVKFHKRSKSCGAQGCELHTNVSRSEEPSNLPQLTTNLGSADGGSKYSSPCSWCGRALWKHRQTSLNFPSGFS